MAEHGLARAMAKRFEYIRCSHCGDPDSCPEKLISSARAAIMSQLAVSTDLDISVGIACHRLLNESPLPIQVRQEVKAAIDAKIESAGHVEGIGGPAKQRCDYLESYQAAADWVVYDDPAQSRDKRLVQMAKRMQSVQLGTKGHTREQVYADGVAIAMHATLGAGPEHQHEALLCLRDLKSFVQDKQLPQEPDIYPRDPGEFASMHPAIFAAAYAHGGPVPCPMDPMVLRILKARAPCRNSRYGCEQVSSHRPRALALLNQPANMPTVGRHLALPSFSMCGQMPGRGATRQAMQRAASRSDIDITYLGPYAGSSNRSPSPPNQATTTVSGMAASPTTEACMAFGKPALAPEPNSVAPAATAGVSPVVSAETAGVSPVVSAESLVEKLKNKIAGIKHGTNSKPKGKAKAAIRKKPAKKESVKAKGKCGGAKPAPARATVRADKDAKLSFSDEWLAGPIYYGPATIYVKAEGAWQVKPAPGVRTNWRKFTFDKKNPAKTFPALAAHLRSLK